jgi:hypothetical protein
MLSSVVYIYAWRVTESMARGVYRRKQIKFKGTVSPVLSRLKVVFLNKVESGEVPLVI